MPSFSNLLRLLCSLHGAFVLLHAQTLSLSGTITDGVGFVPKLSVTLKDGAGKSQQTSTNAQGEYRFDGLASGVYEVMVSREGFAPLRKSIDLRVCSELSVRSRLDTSCAFRRRTAGLLTPGGGLARQR